MVKLPETARCDRERHGCWFGVGTGAALLALLIDDGVALSVGPSHGSEAGQLLHAGFGGLVVGTLIILLAIPIGPPLYAWLRRTLPLWRRDSEEALPLLVFPIPAADRLEARAGVADGPDLPARAAVESPQDSPAEILADDEPVERAAGTEPDIDPALADPAPGTAAGVEREESMPLLHAGRAGEEGPSSAGVAAPEVNGGSSVLAPAIGAADDGWGETLQLLPGRLEIVSGIGTDSSQEIRFVRAGPVTEVTIGRTGTNEPGYVRIAAPTVSRRHALLRFENGGWKISNLSKTNPLRLNGKELSGRSAQPLSSGDRLELGDVVLIFHES